MTILSAETIHASCVAIDGHAVLIEGRSGSGKSDLALRLIDRGAMLVSDDYTLCQRRDGALLASPPPTIAGKLEIRGIGIVGMEHAEQVPVALIIRIEEHPERLPETADARIVAGVTLPVVPLPALEPSSPIKVEIAVQRAVVVR